MSKPRRNRKWVCAVPQDYIPSEPIPQTPEEVRLKEVRLVESILRAIERQEQWVKEMRRVMNAVTSDTSAAQPLPLGFSVPVPKPMSRPRLKPKAPR